MAWEKELYKGWLIDQDNHGYFARDYAGHGMAAMRLDHLRAAIDDDENCRLAYIADWTVAYT